MSRSIEPIRVALIAAPYGEGPQRVVPLGAMSVAGYARAQLGDEVDITVYDCSGRKPGDLGLLDALLEARVDVVGFPVYSSHVAVVGRWAAYLRARAPGLCLVAGGPHVTLTGAAFVERWGHVFDYTIAGDGERPFTALLEAIARGDADAIAAIPGVAWLDRAGDVHTAPPGTPLEPEAWPSPFAARVVHDNDALVFTDRRERRQRRAVALVSSRSCPMRCTFCAIIAMPGKWRSAPIASIVSWLTAEHARRPFEHVYFMDANFFVDPRRVRALIDALTNALPGVTWSASSTVGMLLRMTDDMPALVARGLRLVELGIESGSRRQLAILGKKATVQQNLDAVRLLQENGVEVGLDYIMFYPEQTLDELRDNLMFLRQAHLTQEESFDHYLNALQLYPGTPLRSTYEQRLGRRFDCDELPDPGALFFDERVARVYRLFAHDFKRRYLPRVGALLDTLRTTAVRSRAHGGRRAQELRLESISLRHLPFKVLWSLCERPDAPTLEDAVPWLRGFEEYANGLCPPRASFEEHVA